MKRILYFTIFLGISQISIAQSFLFTEFGNTILLRPNLGYEFRKKNHSFGIISRYQSNSFIWVTEYPGLTKSRGTTIDIFYKKYFKKYLYFETDFRFQKYSAPDYIHGWQGGSLYNSNTRFGPILRIGAYTGNHKRMPLDFGLGLGFLYGQKNMWISDSQKFTPDYKSEKTLEELKKEFPREKGLKFGFYPQVQLRWFFRLKKK